MMSKFDTNTRVLFEGDDASVSCFESDKVTCNVFRNGTTTHFDVKCKAPPPTTSGARSLAATGTQAAALASVLVALLVL
jgi:hypothetical protein